MTNRLISLADGRITLGDRDLFDGIGLITHRGDRFCLVGRNGSGKSTLLRVLGGLRELDSGRRFAEPGLSIGYLDQEVAREPGPTVADFIAGEIAKGPEDDADHRVRAVIDAAGLHGPARLDQLSGGEFRKVAIMRALAADPDLLLLDEPTNHLDLPTIEWLERRLSGFRGGLVVISHDRAFLRGICNRCLWLDRGRLHRLDAGFDRFEEWSTELVEKEARDAEKRDKRITEETRWLREGLTARRKRNQGRLRRLEKMRAEQARRQPPAGLAAIEPGSGPKSGNLVVEAVGISKSYGDTAIVRDFSIRVMRGDRVGVIGRNGAGKTTLLSLLTGRLEPDSGMIRLGVNLEINVIDQRREVLSEQATLRQVLTGGDYDQLHVQGRLRHVAGYMKDFLFEPAQLESPVSVLSGGERNRLLLARAFARPSNLLVVDEPTNDLDMETLDLLQEVLADYDGTVLLVSHDRDFLDRVVTGTVAFEGDGRWREYPGGYTDYLRQSRSAPTRDSSGKNVRKPRKRPARPRAERARTLDSRDRRALERLPGDIARLEREISLLETAVSDPDAYRRNPEKFNLATRRLQALQSELAEKEDAWLKLELLKEEQSGP